MPQEQDTPQRTIPTSVSRNVEFVSGTNYSGSTELESNPTNFNINFAEYRSYVKALEDGGFDYTLNGYTTGSADSFVVAATTGQLTERIKLIVALRPNTTSPLVAAQKLATLDQLTEGRAVVHLISGIAEQDQIRQGDYLPKIQRYERMSEYIDILREAWTAQQPFSHEGEYYKFDGFGPGFPTSSGTSIPISVGGQSDEAFEIGGSQADIFTLAGEPLSELRKEIDRVHTIADGAGRLRQKIWVSFRVITANTDELAWEKAHEILHTLTARYEAGTGIVQRFTPLSNATLNKRSERVLDLAKAADHYDRALWTPPARATGGGAASAALVGSYETVAAAILDYVDAGVELVSLTGYDGIRDIRDFGAHVIPLVRQELSHRAANNSPARLQIEHLGFYADEFTQLAESAAIK